MAQSWRDASARERPDMLWWVGVEFPIFGGLFWRVERRLAALLAADVAGYSRLIGANEEGPLARLKAVRKDVVDPAIASHRGRIVKTTGDSMLTEFPGAVDAVCCSPRIVSTEKPRTMPGLSSRQTSGKAQYFATTGPAQLKV
jgi:hypothetical protein